MSRDWLLYLDDIIASTEKIGRLVVGRSYETFLADEAVFDASIVWDVATNHVPSILSAAQTLLTRFETSGDSSSI